MKKQPQTGYTLSNAREAQRAPVARVHGARQRVEELLEEGKQEVECSGGHQLPGQHLESDRG